MSIQGLFISPLNVGKGSDCISNIDTHLLPPEVDKIFRRVQDSAHYMPDWQMDVSCLPSLRYAFPLIIYFSSASPNKFLWPRLL
jgi:hypothetical protein